jgi:hypothetical protein
MQAMRILLAAPAAVGLWGTSATAQQSPDELYGGAGRSRALQIYVRGEIQDKASAHRRSLHARFLLGIPHHLPRPGRIGRKDGSRN